MPTAFVFDESSWGIDRAVDVRLGRQVDDRHRAMFVEQRRHERRIADVSLDEAMSRFVDHRGERFEVAGVGQLVEIDDAECRPSPITWRTKWLPMKPAPPVIRMESMNESTRPLRQRGALPPAAGRAAEALAARRF